MKRYKNVINHVISIYCNLMLRSMKETRKDMKEISLPKKCQYFVLSYFVSELFISCNFPFPHFCYVTKTILIYMFIHHWRKLHKFIFKFVTSTPQWLIIGLCFSLLVSIIAVHKQLFFNFILFPIIVCVVWSCRME